MFKIFLTQYWQGFQRIFSINKLMLFLICHVFVMLPYTKKQNPVTPINEFYQFDSFLFPRETSTFTGKWSDGNLPK